MITFVCLFKDAPGFPSLKMNTLFQFLFQKNKNTHVPKKCPLLPCKLHSPKMRNLQTGAGKAKEIMGLQGMVRHGYRAEPSQGPAPFLPALALFYKTPFLPLIHNNTHTHTPIFWSSGEFFFF